MEEKKRYKATDVNVEGPFDGWIIEELDEDEYEKAEAKEKEIEAKKASSGPAKLTPQEAEKKRKEQLDKIKMLIGQKRALQEKHDAQITQSQSQPVELTEEQLIQKSKDTGIPVEVLRMIEEKKKEIRARKKQNPNGTKPSAPVGKEIADSVQEKIARDRAERYVVEREGGDDQER